MKYIAHNREFKESFDLDYGLELILTGTWLDDKENYDYDISEAVISSGKTKVLVPDAMIGEIAVGDELIKRLENQEQPKHEPDDHYSKDKDRGKPNWK